MLEAIHWRHSPMDGPEVVVEKLDVAPRYLKGRWAVPEDSLKREDITTVGEEGSRETMTEDMR